MPDTVAQPADTPTIEHHIAPDGSISVMVNGVVRIRAHDVDELAGHLGLLLLENDKLRATNTALVNGGV